MKLEVSLNGAAPVIRALNGAATKIHAGWKREAYTVGARAVQLMKEKRRNMPRPNNPGNFAVRSGVLIRSYHHNVDDTSGGVTLSVGAIKPSEKGQVPLHARVHEGFDRSGGKVSLWVIRPRQKPYLWFPVRRGGGLAVSNIVAWVRTKRVAYRPTPVVEPVGKDIPAALRVRCGEVFQNVLRAA